MIQGRNLTSIDGRWIDKTECPPCKILYVMYHFKLPQLTRPQSSLLRKERSARGDGKEERGREKRRLSPFLLPITPRASLLSQERRLGTSQLPHYCERNPDKKFLLVTRLARTDDNGVRTVDICLENKRKGVLILEISLLLLSRPAIKVATAFCLCFVLFCFWFVH